MYVAAISAFHNDIDKQSVWKNNLVVRFLWGTRWLNPLRPSTIPIWDLALVLKALTCVSLKVATLKVLSFKTALLLAFAFVK